MPEIDRLHDALRLLADPTRLRVLRALAHADAETTGRGRESSLNSGELTRVLGVAQSAVSRHLRMLREGGLVTERREGRFVYFALAASRGDDVWEALRPLVVDAGDESGDLARLADVLRGRREQRVLEGRARRGFVPGRSWAAWARALAWLVDGRPRVLDVGCGDGALTLEIARFAGHVTGIDVRADFLRRARAAARAAGVRNVRFAKGDMECLNREDDEFDLVTLSQSLHFSGDPARVLAEAVRVTAPGGAVLVIDLLPHDEEWVRERLGHKRLGFDQDELRRLLRGAGLKRVRVETTGDGGAFRPLLAMGRKPR